MSYSLVFLLVEARYSSVLGCRRMKGRKQMSFTDMLTEARKAVEEAGLDGELRTIGFAKVLDALLGSQTTPRDEPSSSPNGSGGQREEVLIDNPVAALVARLKVSEETIRHVFHLNGDELEIVVAPGKLDSRSSTATKQLALLVAAGRQGAGLEEWTGADRIRGWCEHYKRLDPSNFAGTLKEMEDVFSFRGTPRRRELRMTAPAWANASELVKKLGGES